MEMAIFVGIKITMHHNNINRIPALLLCLVSAVLVQGQKIKVRLADAESDSVKVVLVNADFSGHEIRETVALKRKTFVYDTGDSENCRLVVCSYDNGSGRDAVFRGIVVPGEKCTFTVSDGKETCKGSAFYREYREVLERMSSLPRGQRNRAASDYIGRFPDSDVSAALLLSMDNVAQETLDRLGPDVRTGRMSNVVTAVQKALDDKKKAAASSGTQTAAVAAPDFTLKDINGKDLTLSGLRGKYVVLDFWGSWCGWCIKGMPDMKDVYGRYKDRMEIVGIDCSDPEDVWKKTVEKLQLPWLHVYNHKDSDVLKDYGVRGFPTKVVIDPSGNIVKVVVGESPEFYQFLENLFSE